MALVLSGALSMGGSTADRSINCELGLSGTAQISLNDAAVRSLAGVPSGAISIDDFYGASAGPSTLGEVFEGGYYTGTITAASSSYFLILSPNATGCACCQWKTTQTDSGMPTDLVNGYNNTYTYLANADHPAGNFTATRSINGFVDWYLPAQDEVTQMVTNKASMPAGQGYPGFPDRDYWTSTEPAVANYQACCTNTGFVGFFREEPKNVTLRLRSVRREPF